MKKVNKELEERIEIFERLLKVAEGDEYDEFYEINKNVINFLKYLIEDTKDKITEMNGDNYEKEK